MFSKRQSQDSQQECCVNQSTFSQSMMIGEINLECEKEVSGQMVEAKFVPETRYLCSECTFEKTVELSQQILQMRQRLDWYQKQVKDLETIAHADEPTIREMLAPLEQKLNRELTSDELAQKQLQHLKRQLASIQDQLAQQHLLTEQCNSSLAQFIHQRTVFQQQLFASQEQHLRLTKHMHEHLNPKEHLLQSTLDTFTKTNFVSILYTINFENSRSYLNGQKITHQNAWKIVQILLFYQLKYEHHYHPLYHIFWPQMKLEKDPQQQIEEFPQTSLLDSINFGHLLRKESAKEVDIDCDSEDLILTKWMPCLLLEVKHLFNFLNQQAQTQQKLRYDITRDGEFDSLKNKTFKNSQDKFNLTIKYLVTNIDQINKIEFFARQQRIHNQ